MANQYERIAASAPVNAQAAKVIARGESWIPSVELQDYFSDCPPIKAVPQSAFESGTFVDFTGREIGRLRIIGLMAEKNTKRPASWVCRCKCGAYCSRSSKSLKIGLIGGNSFNDRCGMCAYQQKILSKEWKEQKWEAKA